MRNIKKSISPDANNAIPAGNMVPYLLRLKFGGQTYTGHPVGDALCGAPYKRHLVKSTLGPPCKWHLERSFLSFTWHMNKYYKGQRGSLYHTSSTV